MTSCGCQDKNDGNRQQSAGHVIELYLNAVTIDGHRVLNLPQLTRSILTAHKFSASLLIP